jgi:hypothetical protein
MSKAAELAKQLFGGMKDAVQAVAPGLNAEKIMGDVKSEAVRGVKQTAAELSSALFSQSNAFVQYGDGQKTPNGPGVHGAEAQKENEGHGR